GNRPDAEEDGHAESAARELAAGAADGTLPPFVGIRIKPLTADLGRRALATLDRFLGTLVGESGGALPAGFVVTLPKVTRVEQVEALAAALGRIEERLGLAAGAVPIELMVETPRSIVGADGRVALPRLVAAAGGRCRGAHFGTYDYTASLGITAAEQRMDHPVCDLAKQVMQVALAGTGAWLSDGATNVLPVAPHRGDGLSAEQRAENRRVVHAAWRLHARHVTHSLVGGFYQGWDLHPAQLPSRYAAVYAFFLAGAAAAGERLRAFVEGAARATLSGDVFDDAATGQGLLNFFLRATACGALAGEEARRLSGLEAGELASRSFLRILEGRRAGAAAAP
ncbi:MAG TPA: aldolase/citrate lyase family protein, partial [Thermoanaerobaculia bacterium]